MSKPITKDQMAKLSPIIERAWIAQGQPHLGAIIQGKKGPKAASKTEALTMFRRGELYEATTNGAASFKDVLNRDFEAVARHFLDLAGEWTEAMKAAMHEGTRGTRQRIAAMKTMLGNAAKATGDAKKWSMGYVNAIMRSEHPGKTLEQLAPDALQRMVITISSRTRKAIKASGRRVDAAGALVHESEEAAQFAAADEEGAL